MGRKIYPYYVLLKLYGAVFTRVIENSILVHITRKKNRSFSSSRFAKKEYAALQNEFHKVFQHYDMCRNCTDHCCHGHVNRFDLIDCYVYDMCLAEGVSPWHRIPHLFTAIGELFGDMLGANKTRPPTENCIHLSHSSGCILPIGTRPGMCFAGGCYKLISAFNNEDLKKYSSLLSNYIVLHVKCFFGLLWEIATVRSGQNRSEDFKDQA